MIAVGDASWRETSAFIQVDSFDNFCLFVLDDKKQKLSRANKKKKRRTALINEPFQIAFVFFFFIFFATKLFKQLQKLYVFGAAAT